MKGELHMENEQVTQILRAINNLSEDLHEFKSEMIARWDANDKRWEKNEKRWEQNEKRWKESDKHFDEIDKKLKQIEIRIDNIDGKIERRYKDVLKVFDRYETSVDNMYQENKKRIINLEKKFKIVNI